MQENIQTVKKLLEELLGFMDPNASVEYEESATMGNVFNIVVSRPYELIGRQGTILHALDLLLHQMAAQALGSSYYSFRFTIDIDDYKRKREWFLKETAKQAADQAKRTERPVNLEPMPNYERRIVHAYIQNNFPDMKSESAGRDPRRYVVIKKSRPS